MLPALQSVDHGQPNEGVLSEEFVQAPQPQAVLCMLVVPRDMDGANIVPAHHDILYPQQNRWRPWCLGESKFFGRLF